MEKELSTMTGRGEPNKRTAVYTNMTQKKETTYWGNCRIKHILEKMATLTKWCK